MWLRACVTEDSVRLLFFFFFQAEAGIRDLVRSRGLGDVYKRQKWMRDEAEKRIGHLYPKVRITAEMAAERPDLLPLSLIHI